MTKEHPLEIITLAEQVAPKEVRQDLTSLGANTYVRHMLHNSE